MTNCSHRFKSRIPLTNNYVYVNVKSMNKIYNFYNRLFYASSISTAEND